MNPGEKAVRRLIEALIARPKLTAFVLSKRCIEAVMWLPELERFRDLQGSGGKPVVIRLNRHDFQEFKERPGRAPWPERTAPDMIKQGRASL